jgi:predicted Zn-dependent peptidase
MLFKGTKDKNTKDISNIAESAGAVIDGFTSKEMSGIYCRYFATNFDLIMDLINDIILHPVFDAQELEKEKDFILQEINSSQDNPQDYVFTLLHEVLFPNHGLSYPITGTADSIKSLTRDIVADYYQEIFLPSKICISAVGKIDHNKLIDSLSIAQEQLLASNQTSTVKPNTDIERTTIFQARKDLTQLHAAAGSFIPSYHDEKKYGLILLNNIWGGTMSSRLFHRVREQEGLVYTIFSFVDFYSDVGIWGAYFVSDVKNQEKIFLCGYEETMNLKKNGITKQELESTRNYSKGSLVLGVEDPMSRMVRNANNDLLLGRVVPIEESLSKYDQITVDMINNLTAELPVKYSVANIGSIDQIEFLKRHGGPQKVIIRN